MRRIARLLRSLEHRLATHELHGTMGQFQSCGADVVIHPTVTIVGARSVALGNNVHIGADCFIYAEGGLQIRDNVHISRRVTIYASDHDFRGRPELPFGPRRVWKEVVVERNAWIGMNAAILPGVRIGAGAIVGMGAVVSRDVPPGAIVGPHPVRILGTRDPEATAAAEVAGAYGGTAGAPVPAQRRTAWWPTGESARPAIAFVVSTGRSGSTTLARWLDRHPSIDARHEPRPQLIQWATEFAEGRVGRDEMRDRLAGLFLAGSVYRPGALRVESDARYAVLIPLLAEIFPDARFLWITRRAEAVVASTVGRGWYADTPDSYQTRHVPWYFEAFRITGRATGMSDAAWRAMPAFEKNCWYWVTINETIRDAFTELTPARTLRVPLEELDARAGRIATFLGVTRLPGRAPVANAADFARSPADGWTTIERAAFERWCHPMMGDLYPDHHRPGPARSDAPVGALADPPALALPAGDGRP